MWSLEVENLKKSMRRRGEGRIHLKVGGEGGESDGSKREMEGQDTLTIPYPLK